MPLPDWERQRLIDALGGAELERWEQLGHAMTDAMRGRLANWRAARAAKAAARAAAEAAEREARRKTELAEEQWTMHEQLRERERRAGRRNTPQTYRTRKPRKRYPAHGKQTKAARTRAA